MFKYIIWTIILYCLIRFVFNFVVPVFRATRQMKKQVRDFQNKMQQENQFNSNTQQQSRPAQKAKAGDYIDFEEIK